MFDDEFAGLSKSLEVSVILTPEERNFIARVADRVKRFGAAGDPSQEALDSVCEALDSRRDLAEPIHLADGIGRNIRDILIAGARGESSDEWGAEGQMADAILAKMIRAYGPSVAQTDYYGSADDMRNLYRAEIGQPVWFRALVLSQCAAAAREATAFAAVTGLKLRVEGHRIISSDDPGIESEIVTSMSEVGIPALQFVNTATGGRPNSGQGFVRVEEAGTFFATFSAALVINGKEHLRQGLNGTGSLRMALIELGHLRDADRAVRTEFLPYLRYVAQTLEQGPEDIREPLADLVRSTPLTPTKAMIKRVLASSEALEVAFRAEGSKALAEGFPRWFCETLAAACATPSRTEAVTLLNITYQEMLESQKALAG